MATSPTQLTLRHMRDQGYFCEVVEHWNSFTHKREDLFGFGDIICLRKGEVVLVQTTTASNVSARVRKITDHANVGFVRDAGMQICVHGWAKIGNRWNLTRCVDLS